MNEQDIINRLTRLEKKLDEILLRLSPTVTVVPQPMLSKSAGSIGTNNWPWPTLGANGAAGPVEGK